VNKAKLFVFFTGAPVPDTADGRGSIKKKVMAKMADTSFGSEESLQLMMNI